MDVISKLDCLNPVEIPPISDLNISRKKKNRWVYLVASIFAISISLVGYKNLDKNDELVLANNSYYSPNELWNSKTIIILEKRSKK